MSYLVLARKYRPQTFDEMVGQGHITELLKKAITIKRIAHAFLFCGPRGIGKTSCARILAKSLNCEKGPTLVPCGQCSACKEIALGTSFDVLEIDGASNRGIDEIRTLRENVKFAPGYGRYKVYIVDEVHMLTAEAFNALLKTLEEPPEHVKFIFATTVPHKVPSTIISRCQRFDFKRMGLSEIQETLQGICKKEKFEIEEAALFAIARAAQGSLRDALSILDQLSALSQRKIEGNDVYSMLGMVETELLFELTDCLGGKNCVRTLEIFDRIVDQGKDVKQLGKDLIGHFRNLMILKVGGKALGKLIDYPLAAKERLLRQSELFSLREIVKAIETFIEAQETARTTGFDRMPIEIAFAKLTYQKEVVLNAPAPGAPPEGGAPGVSPPRKASPMAVLKNEKGQVDFSDAPLDLNKVKRLWNAVTHAVSRQKMSAATYLQEGSPYEVKGNTIVIAFSSDHVFQKESLEDKNILRMVEKIFAQNLKSDVTIEYKIVEDYKSSTEEEPLVKSALETFKGKVINQWHNE